MNAKNKTYIKSGLLLLGGLFLGWLFFHKPSQKSQPEKAVAVEAHKEEWTCSMHPQIRMDKPGKCPICGMDLIPVNNNTASANMDAVQLDEAAMQIANIQTTVVGYQKPVKEIRLYGKIQPDERTVKTLPAHIPGRIEQLLVNYTGETISQGQVVARIYSPEMQTAQQELIEARKFSTTNPILLEAAREKLRQWKLTPAQIEEIEKGGGVKETIEVRSQINGTITNRKVNVGDYVSRGQSLFEVVDLSRVWVLFDAYETDLPWIQRGAEVVFTVQALPGKEFRGNVTFIEPVINPQTRVAGVRIEVNNAGAQLKPEMFATGIIHTVTNQSQALVVPKTAVLWTGKRSVVYLKDRQSESPSFIKTDVTLGAETGDGYVIQEGLKEGDEVVANGTFAVDAAAQLAGKKSMMTSGETREMGGHDHGAVVTPASENINKTTFSVSGNCDMCKERIETAARSVKGVKTAEWNSGDKQLQISYDASLTRVIAVHQAVANAGHDTEKVKADARVYNTLPECCLYRKEGKK